MAFSWKNLIVFSVLVGTISGILAMCSPSISVLLINVVVSVALAALAVLAATVV
jgi:hypothetical protein